MPNTRNHLAALILKQEKLCCICGSRLPDDLAGIHVDHILPRSLGGSDSPENLQAAHAGCNMRKKNRMPGAQRRDKRVAFYLTADEEAALADVTWQARARMSDWARQAVLDAVAAEQARVDEAADA